MRKHRLSLCWVAFILFCAVFLSLSGSIAAAPDPITGAEPAEGFGAKATGGHGCEEVVVTSFEELKKAINRDNVYIKVQGDLVGKGTNVGNGSNITIDGGGTATLWGGRFGGERMLELTGKNIVVKDIHLRNSGDNLSFKGPAENILVSHVTTSGAYDDGMSIGYGTKNITVQYCFFVGCTRSCFIKYPSPKGVEPALRGPTNVTLHHNWFKAQWMRGPLVSDAFNVDIRNQLSEDWGAWGGPRFEGSSTGNCVNSVFAMHGVTGGKRDAAHYTYDLPKEDPAQEKAKKEAQKAAREAKRKARSQSGEKASAKAADAKEAPAKEDTAKEVAEKKGPSVTRFAGKAYFAGSLYHDCSGRPGNSDKEIPCAPVTTQPASEVEATVRAKAGCLPRDEVDKVYAEFTGKPGTGASRPWVVKTGPDSTVSAPSAGK